MQYFKLFNSCRLAKGAHNSLIYDLERVNNSNTIPNSLYELLTTHTNKSLDEIKAAYNNEYDLIIDEYFEFLISNEYIFFCSQEELQLFPTRDFEWKSPRKITNSIIDFDGSLTIDRYIPFIDELSTLGCEAIQFRSYVSLSLPQLKSFIYLFKETSIVCIELILPFNPKLTDDIIINLQNEYPRIIKVSFYKSPEDRGHLFIEHFKKNVIPDEDCGKVESKFFSIGFETFAEAQCHNTCLNRKISVDKTGAIKGCPSMKKSYGNIGTDTISNALRHDSLQKIWSINKDTVEICKDCEYRYCCTDCRAFVDDESNPFSRPSKCNYNPYMGLWKGENGYIEVNKWLTLEHDHQTA